MDLTYYDQSDARIPSARFLFNSALYMLRKLQRWCILFSQPSCLLPRFRYKRVLNTWYISSLLVAFERNILIHLSLDLTASFLTTVITNH